MEDVLGWDLAEDRSQEQEADHGDGFHHIPYLYVGTLTVHETTGIQGEGGNSSC